MADTLAAHHRRRVLLQQRQAELRARNAARPRSLRGAFSDPGYTRLRELFRHYLAKRGEELDERKLEGLLALADSGESNPVRRQIESPAPRRDCRGSRAAPQKLRGSIVRPRLLDPTTATVRESD